MQIEWADRYSVNVDVIDNQHKYFFSLINEMFAALEAREYTEKVDGILEKLLAYADFHFKTEEALLEGCDCPELQHQRNEHYKLTHKLNSLIKKRDKVKDMLPYYYEIINFLKRWLIHHLTDDDQRYVEHLKKHGVT